MSGGDTLMKYIKVTVDGTDFYLQELYDGTWAVMQEAPSYPGIYPVTVEVVQENGVVLVIGDDDPVLGEFLKLLVLGESRSELIKYLPPFLQEFIQFQSLMKSEDHEIDRLQDSIPVIFDDSYILTASSERIIEWEKKLNINPVGTLAQRKSFIISHLRGQGKLNEQRIKYIVNAFTGGDSIVNFTGSTILVKILVPANGDIYLFPDVERALNPKIPAHIALQVQRFYSTWADVKTDFASWSTIGNLTDWKELKNYIP